MTAGPSGLAARAQALGLVAPDRSGRSLASVLPAAAASLGVLDAQGRNAAAQAALGLPAAERVCVVLVDGLGFENLSDRSGHAPFLRSLLHDGAELTCGFPSTTAVSMGIFGTGTGPGRTGMVGYSARDPRTGSLANLVSWEGAPDPLDLQREPTLFEELTTAGVRVTSIGPARFAESGMTRAALRGARYWAAESLESRVDAAAFELMTPGLVYLYWGDVDKVGHHEGSESWQWGDALELADRELARLRSVLPAGTEVVVTADHGMVDVDRSRQHDVGRTPALQEGVRAVAGEPRAVHLHATKRKGAAALAQRWADILGDDALVATRDEVVEAGWFGEVAEHVEPWIGDVVVAARGRATVVDSRVQSARSIALVGVHGSLTPREMRVPYLRLTV